MTFRRAARALAHVAIFPFFFVVWLLLPRRRKRLIWAPIPITNYKYWSAAMRQAGFESQTFMRTWFETIQSQSDFDLYFDDLLPAILRRTPLAHVFRPYVAFLHVVRHAAILHMPYTGGPLGSTAVWRLEAYLLRWAGVRTVVMSHGGDVYMYSKVLDPTVRHGLLLSYPQFGREEAAVARRVRYWSRHADVIFAGFVIDGLGRWDLPVANFVTIDTDEWSSRCEYASTDGSGAPVKLLHAPNHRGAKGTEFLIRAVEDLRAEGLSVELVLAERIQNRRVRELMHEVDILTDQFVLPGYGLTAIEAMASGLPVLCNLENDVYTRLFRRYSYLEECPVVSTSVENLTATLRRLITEPELRRELGRAGRAYVEKYHSPKAAQYMFGSVYQKLVEHKNVDLMNLFHPLKSSFSSRAERIVHPLVDSHLPAGKQAKHMTGRGDGAQQQDGV